MPDFLVGWVVLAVVVILLDIVAVLLGRLTLSATFLRWVRASRWVALVLGLGWIILTSHLFLGLP